MEDFGQVTSVAASWSSPPTTELDFLAKLQFSHLDSWHNQVESNLTVNLKPVLLQTIFLRSLGLQITNESKLEILHGR